MLFWRQIFIKEKKLSYSAKVSRKGGSLKKLFVVNSSVTDSNVDYFCKEDSDFDHRLFVNEEHHAVLDSEEDILTAWMDGLKTAEEQED